MNTRMLGGTLIAFGDARRTFTALPLLAALPLYRLVPTVRTTPERPGSMVNVTVDGATPLEAVAISAAEPFGIACGTAKVSVPLPILLMRTAVWATPGLQSSCAKNTVVVSGIRLG